ncbi:sugar phosphate isomerase/epimerase [Halobacillus salinarum]|uniref:Sugar phosphate isomerase/epimerase n=1 Tax=Halobacillus salinarum TaxID=2932257 RepID=A0ABY4EPJ5_9BACI|nr:sugar phosphate isomerase/epimerase [Halobacillus salinarum]UOQ45554.1 sugar phosphate isomerase/epimerase [Halobacillus salinarum]
MKTGLVTDILGHQSFEEMLDTCEQLGVETLELGCGNWSDAPHVDLDALLEHESSRRNFLDAIERKGMSIAALNCSGNQLAPGAEGEAHKRVVNKTFRLAGLLGVEKVVMMSGCPGGGPGDKTPNWITHPILPPHFEALNWQWNEVAVPYWKEAVKTAEEYGVEKIAIENLGYNLVYNPETFFRLKNEVGDRIGMNFDPSHLFWMGGDPIRALRELGNSIYHIHAKDVRIERGLAERQGLIDIKPMDSYASRSWNYAALGHGHEVSWWKEFFTVAKMAGYENEIVLEMEDLTMDPLTGVKKSMDVLKEALPRTFEEKRRQFT